MGPPRHFGQRDQLPHTRPSCMAQCTRSEILQVSTPQVVGRLTLSETGSPQKQYRNVVRLSAVNSRRVAVLAGPQLYASSVNFHAHSGSHSQHQRSVLVKGGQTTWSFQDMGSN